ncbi:hypothetical protein [Hymenobacter lapidiphilus]|uniref:Uncharacterized protein n=1 Tax=Hymenobacter lapidiphilus TaxID=2608003 RepID=A0A7Y7U682_9BACT|nr:hypothetical protein [Hymenobacter lapidiphilus]NVO32233.1 hypothetical protein [Hymenobacter lapidiphilus]
MLGDGQNGQQGIHEALMRDEQSLYRALYERQLQSGNSRAATPERQLQSEEA